MTDRNAEALNERMFRLDSKVAIVTGGGGGIGGAICRLFANVGASVACLDLSDRQANATADAIRASGGRAIGIACDVSSEAQTNAAVSQVVAELGLPTVLVNTAAAMDRTGSILEIDLEEWEKVHRVNLTGAFLMSRAVIPSMIEAGGGSIVHVSSHLGYFGFPGRASYSSTKAALHQLARSMTADHAARGIRTNTLSPGPIATERVAYRFAEFTPAEREKRISMIPLRRIGTPQEAAMAALFLASDASSFMTGADLLVDGGYASTGG